MTGLDANIVVRLFIEDDPAQAVAVRRIAERFTEEEPGFISLVALAETVWVLESVYDLPAIKVADLVEALLQTESLVVQNADEVFKAVRAVQESIGTFDDALIAAIGQSEGCTTTLTFDRRASRLPDMTLLSATA